MADATSSMFTKKASDKLRSPDDLDEFVRVTNPSVWLVLAACAALLIGLVAWGVLGTAETSVGATGACVKGETICFLPDSKASSIHIGDIANVGGEQMKVAKLSTVPVSRAEAREIVGNDYLASTLVNDDWSYVVHFSGDNAPTFEEGIPLGVTITTERIPPISLVFGNAA